MYTCGIRINAKLVKEGSFRINFAKLVKEELRRQFLMSKDCPCAERDKVITLKARPQFQVEKILIIFVVFLDHKFQNVDIDSFTKTVI